MRLGLVTEAFVDRSLGEVLDWLAEAAPAVTDLEVGSGGYAPAAHCPRAELLGNAEARARWLDEIERRGYRVAALNAWGNPLHPDRAVADAHDRDLRETIALAAELRIDRVVALAGCPAANPSDGGVPHFAAGGWLPYLEGVHEVQWERAVAPYWTQLAALAEREHPDLLICVELHPGTAVYNVETFSRFADLAPNLAANLDPSHFFWQRMDPLEVVARLGERIGHAHAKDIRFNDDRLALNGLLDHRWPGEPAEMPWTFAAVGHARDGEWWSDLIEALERTSARSIAIEHEDPSMDPRQGVPDSARVLAAAAVAR